MTDASSTAERSPSLWSPWAEAKEIEREHFKTEQGHRAWSRVCGGCGEGDFLERKNKPTSAERPLQGRGFPSLPEPVLEEGEVRARFRTPPGRLHTCAPAKGPASGRRR